MSARRQEHASLVAFLALLAVALVSFLRVVGPYVLAVLIGEILSLLVAGPYARLRRLRLPASLASFLATLGLTILVIVPLSGFVVMGAREGVTLVKAMSDKQDEAAGTVQKALDPLGRVMGGVDAARRASRDLVRRSASVVGAGLLAAAKDVPGLILQVILALVSCFFFLMQGDRLLAWLVGRIPLEPEVSDALIDAFKTTAVSTVWATLAAAASQAAVVGAGFAVLGVPRAFLAGAVTFVCAWIPILGCIPACLAGAGWLWAEGEIGKAVAMAIGVGGAAGTIDNVVRPLVLKGRDDMHPLLALVSVLGGISAFGLLGVFVGPLVAAVVTSLLRTWPLVARRYGLSLDAPERVRSGSSAPP